jgi:serine protease Do
MRHCWMTAVASTTGLFLALASSVPAESRLEKLPGSLMPLPLVNGPEVRRALLDLSRQVLPSSGWLEDDQGRALAGVTFVGKEGYFVSKASEVVSLHDCRLRPRPGDDTWAVREVRRDVKVDLVLGQAVASDNRPVPVTPVTWAPSVSAGLGQWLVSPALTALEEGREGVPNFDLRLGVLSASRRAIPGQGAALGITGRPSDGGLQINGVAEESPAFLAGLQENDLLVAVDGQPASSIPDVNVIIQKHQIGDEVELKIKRQGKEIRKRVRLASRSRVVANWEGDDYANGGISIRTDDFPEILQHDLPLFPHDMGGPVFDLQGRAIAVNIARADRITTFALPMERFRDTLEKWLEADRHPPAAGKVPK